MRFQLTATMTAALPVLMQLQEHGFEAVFVGGAVRDMLLDLPINDIDIATSALPEQTIQLFPRTIPTGLQHGTVTVIVEGIHYEVTTYREESQYEAHRKPKQVLFISSLDNDLLRRDFTMNAMALRDNGELHDPYNGLADMRNSTLRCVGDADLRFQEDALRMLRAVRFMGAYKYKPALSTWKSLKKHQGLLIHIAMERVRAELDKMLQSENPLRALNWLAASGLLAYCKDKLALPEVLKELLTSQNKCLYRSDALSSISKLNEIELQWATLFLSFNFEEKDALTTMTALKFAGNRTKLIQDMMRLHASILSEESYEPKLLLTWREGIIQYGETVASKWLLVAYSFSSTATNLHTVVLDRLKLELDQMPLKTLKELNISGSQLQRHLKREGGPWLSIMLRRLLMSAAAGEVSNETDKLLELANQWNEEVPINE
ncbi:CCA tRNA nucleotidyltransferase [Paenibacillus sp. L3-i20]|uniref:CCA tRNA nucleotidyltransferase n=1 Tax=Paenibacillus sp. L3-i20 TaxID=2905833 RepID=UPI001EDD6647|nr:CCA tRNA nucleotidyltransferase [Paenibacillus sp. L3-i20]GKU79509.1 CCA-adding enzyme [Paenibacillus sp. L3-i20]